MSLVVVGVADCKISGDPDSVLVTYALGSCIGVAIHDAAARVGGILHFMLPEASLDAAKAAGNPFMFADTGIPWLFRAAYQMGAEKRRLKVWVAGGAQVMDERGVFNIGKRNQLALRKILWRAGVMTQGEDLGGMGSRTLRLEVGSGRFRLRVDGGEERELAGMCPARVGGV